MPKESHNAIKAGLPLYAEARKGDAFQSSDNNAGLTYYRFFDYPSERFDFNHSRGSKNPKGDFVGKFNGKVKGDEKQLANACKRQHKLVEALGGRSKDYQCTWHFVTGMGLAHPIENGMLWHHNLGVPYFPGSGVKGLLKSWLTLTSSTSSDFSENMKRWFGSDDSPIDAEGNNDGGEVAEPLEPTRVPEDPNRCGDLIFFDALPLEPVTMVHDILTPHYNQWLTQGDSGELKNAPGDWEAPVPTPFLAAKGIKLMFSFAPRKPGLVSDEELETLQEQLELALGTLGAGAKTAVGYGIFVDSDLVDVTGSSQ